MSSRPHNRSKIKYLWPPRIGALYQANVSMATDVVEIHPSLRNVASAEFREAFAITRRLPPRSADASPETRTFQRHAAIHKRNRRWQRPTGIWRVGARRGWPTSSASTSGASRPTRNCLCQYRRRLKDTVAAGDFVASGIRAGASHSLRKMTRTWQRCHKSVPPAPRIADGPTQSV